MSGQSGFGLHEGPQSSSTAAVQTQPFVAGAQGSTPMDWEMSPQGSGVPSIPRNHTEAHNFGGKLENASAGDTVVWTGTLYLNGICAHAQASATEAVRNPYAHAFHERSTSLTSTQNAISVAKAFAT